MKIKDIIAREILDSRGNPTVEVDMILENNLIATASVPSGASTGSKEALELRDKDARYHGKGVLKAIENINTIIKPALIGVILNQVVVDKKLLELDGTENKTNLGANATLAVSLAALKVGAKLQNKSLYEYVSNGKVGMPLPMVNIINGGAHADNNLDVQEFMIIPAVKTFKEKIRCASEVFHTLKELLSARGLATSVGDEGGFAPKLKNNEEALTLIVEAIKNSNYEPGKDVFIALDVAANEMYNEKTNDYNLDGEKVSADKLMQYYIMLVNKYPIISIEDPFFESDFESMAVFTKIAGSKLMIVGDDYFVTNKKYLEKAIQERVGNSILLKANQIGTVTEMVDTILLAKKHDYKTIISHRSGETEDTFIADLAVGFNIPYIKTGSMCRGERIAKYNRVMKIEEELTKKR